MEEDDDVDRSGFLVGLRGSLEDVDVDKVEREVLVDGDGEHEEADGRDGTDDLLELRNRSPREVAEGVGGANFFPLRVWR